jgi:hypothetical protein
VTDRPLRVGHQALDRAHSQARVAVVAQQGVDLIGHREPGALGDRTGGAGGFAGTAAEALLLVDLEGHGVASTTVGALPAASKIACSVPM